MRSEVKKRKAAELDKSPKTEAEAFPPIAPFNKDEDDAKKTEDLRHRIREEMTPLFARLRIPDVHHFLHNLCVYFPSTHKCTADLCSLDAPKRLIVKRILDRIKEDRLKIWRYASLVDCFVPGMLEISSDMDEALESNKLWSIASDIIQTGLPEVLTKFIDLAVNPKSTGKDLLPYASYQNHANHFFLKCIEKILNAIIQESTMEKEELPDTQPYDDGYSTQEEEKEIKK